MNHTDDELARRLAKLLDQGADELPPGTADRLAAARRAALARHEAAAPQRAFGWALASSGGPRSRGDSRRPALRVALLAAVAIAAVALWASWQTNGTSPDIAEIDAALLTDDLPINAFLDQRLDSWLKRGSR